MKGSVAMRKIIPLSLARVVIIFAAVATTFAIYRKSASGTGSIRTANWSISRSTSQAGDLIEVIPGVSDDTYDLTVTSSSEVDVTYTIVLSNLPDDIQVKLDEGNFMFPDSVTHKLTISGGTINYNDSIKTKNHTLTFRAASGAQTVSEQEIDIDVEFKQTL